MKQKQTPKIEWKEVELKDIAQFINGRAFKPSDWESEGKLIIRIQDLTGSITNPNYTTKVFENKYLVKKGDLLISWSATLDAFLWNKEEGWLNQHIFKVVPDKKFIYKMYLYYFVKQTIHLFLRESHGSTMKHITKGRFESIKILLPFSNGSPDLKEQERIVKILKESEKLNERGKRADELLNEFLKSVFYEMFLKDKEKFEIKKLGDICDVRDGTHESPKYVNEGFPLITSKNITKGYIDFSEVNLISKKDFDNVNKRSKVDVGDIIMPMIGTIGKPIIVPKTKEFAIKNVALIKFTKTEINNVYIKFLLDSDYFDYLTFMINRGGTQKFIALKDIRSFEIPLPPLPLQQKFAKIVEQIETMKDSVNKTKQNSEELFNSLVSKGFRGEL